MRHLLTLIALSWVVMISSVCLGAGSEGGALSGGCDTVAGDLICEAFYLCDARTSGDTICSEFDLNDATRGFPSYFKVKIENVTGCSSPTLVQVTPVASDVTGDCAASNTGCVDLRGSPLTTGGTQGDTFDTDYEYINATLGGTLTGCSDIEVAIVLFWRRP